MCYFYNFSPFFQRITWPTKDTDREMCLIKGKSEVRKHIDINRVTLFQNLHKFQIFGRETTIFAILSYRISLLAQKRVLLSIGELKTTQIVSRKPKKGFFNCISNILCVKRQQLFSTSSEEMRNF